MSTSSKGSIVVDEIILPIVDMYLEDGQLKVVARGDGPLPAVNAEDFVVHDRSGGVFVKAIGVGGLSWRAVPAGDRVYLVVPLRFTDGLAHGRTTKIR